jgi:hypothetical protein
MHYRLAGTIGIAGMLLLAAHELGGCSGDRFTSCESR